ncbi:valine--tRNA ligase [uncultured Microscilla sp.]|uniref:valine--tRNA ligase n=1 Tax=uncultured Microscilla sp. TaxID=432653 RepID=UPI002639C7C4|nr:valine--tRNA ligase [uncultured Microscilla sp.]
MGSSTPKTEKIAEKYDPKNVEGKWYQYWLDNKFFSSKPDDREPYTIVIPPPNVTGVLHMGHILNNTIQDVLIRKARMEGKNACWVPGTDHASIATEAKVVRMLREKGIKKSEIGRDKFMEYAWEWKEKYGGIILKQLQTLGASCDWDREAFTMDEKRSEQVLDIFIKLYEDKKIYRGLRMVNWDPVGKTTVSNEEVIHKEEDSKLYYINYRIAEGGGYVTIATTRPETLLGDTAVCVNPEDERYKHLIGKKAIVPLVNREVPIIGDKYVDTSFGTGCLKVTPAHDMNDYDLGKKHNLEVIDIFNEDATLNEAAQIHIGKDRFEVRKDIIKDLKDAGCFIAEIPYKNKVGTSERTGAVIEPRLSKQWFVAMKELCEPALENVLNKNVEFHPASFENMYKSWIDGIQDWCISRQLWWGHRIPAYYLPGNDEEEERFVVAKNLDEAFEKAQAIDPNIKKEDLRQEEDVLDTWASSWLWPISVFDADELDYYYPTTTLVTGFDIIFFWVMRMIIAGYYVKDEKPFKHVYFTGMVRDKMRRKMSKSLGNSPDVFKLMERYGTDGLRYGILSSAAAGNDIMFDTPVPPDNASDAVREAFFEDSKNLDSNICETGQKFANKIFQSFRLINMWEVDDSLPNPNKVAMEWLEATFNQELAAIEKGLGEFRISEALTKLYSLFWHNGFCSWYLEMIKPEYDQAAGKSKPIDGETYRFTVDYFERLLNALHPFMPFITEEIWQLIKERGEKDTICLAAYPTPGTQNPELVAQAEVAFEVIQGIRDIRNKKGLKKHEPLKLMIKTDAPELFNKFEQIIQKLAAISEIEFVNDKVAGAASLVVKNHECFIPLEGKIDVEQERTKLEKELERHKRNLNASTNKLKNERFVNNAKPAVVESERKKLADAEAAIKVLEESLSSL